ncbi:chemotaxis protein [Ramlibacter sp. G-1-2-2]|uniref:Chemotaxis protein n=1 Tax=Ramlibacter agri TaxID=2728837 RepID=A0A848HCA7_9BURK|nr:methyl-accepting chemotaxis protein [Ramlibacter agri]NML45188.1 chemotaxis protein [Ramlibacter agri]
MVKTLFGPAFWLLGRLSFIGSFLVIGSLFLLPTGWVLVERDLPLGQLLPPVILFALLALYVLAGLRIQVAMGVQRLVQLTDRIASGELVEDAGLSSAADKSGLWASVMRMNNGLAAIVRQVRASAEAIAHGAQSIAEGNQQLSERTQEQAASLEETASGIEQLSESARQNAESCVRASRLAGNSREVAQQAAQRMEELARTMARIESGSRKVSEILGTVEGIAFQTNILALNAAVEAARAGEQGRGFAVVASEVRVLAQRSAAAAKEIKSLITESVDGVEAGSRLVATTGDTMAQVVGSFAHVTDEIEAIAQATREQSSGVQAVQQAIQQVDSATQQNAALVEEAAGAAQAFGQEAGRLVEVVGRFKTDRGNDRARVVALVKSGVAHVRRNGADKACADFNDGAGAFVRGEDYIFALDTRGTRLAYAPDPSVVGTNSIDAQDADGRKFGRELLALAGSVGFGWCDFKFLNPRTGRVEPKSVYVEAVNGIVLGCGIYSS